MRDKTKIVITVMISLIMLTCLSSAAVKAAETENLEKIIEETIENDKNMLGDNLPEIAKKIFNKLLSVFKKLGRIGSETARVVKLYEALDMNADSYPEDLERFFAEYNKLDNIDKSLFNAITGMLDAKDRLVGALKKFVYVDMYSTKPLNTGLDGNLEYNSANSTIVEVVDGKLIPKSIGITTVTVRNDNGLQEVFKVIVKRPILSTIIRVKNGKTYKVSIPYMVNEVVRSNEGVSYSISGNELAIKGITKGKTYVYIGTTEGKTIKYKVKVD